MNYLMNAILESVMFVENKHFTSTAKLPLSNDMIGLYVDFILIYVGCENL